MNLGFEPKAIARKIEKIQPAYKAIIMLVIVFALVGTLVYFFASPKWKERDDLIKKNNEVQKELAELVKIQNNLAKHRAEYARMQEVLEEVLKQLPETKDIPNLLRNVTAVSEESRLKIKYFEPKQTRNTDVYTELPFEIRFSGPFHNVAYFFDGIRKMERLVKIENFSMEAKGSPTNVIIEGSCSANAYVYLREPKKVSKKKGGKGKK